MTITPEGRRHLALLADERAGKVQAAMDDRHSADLDRLAVGQLIFTTFTRGGTNRSGLVIKVDDDTDEVTFVEVRPRVGTGDTEPCVACGRFERQVAASVLRCRRVDIAEIHPLGSAGAQTWAKRLWRAAVDSGATVSGFDLRLIGWGAGLVKDDR